MEIDIKGHTFQLLPQKAILWKNRKTLLISDLHLGKITHFRKAGLALPSGAFQNNFARLDELTLNNDVERIYFLGDLFHNRYNVEWEQFAAWRNNNSSIEIKIMLGNHDILPMSLFEKSRIAVYEELKEDNFLFTHHPGASTDAGYTFCGHTHPVYCLRSRVQQSIKLPCFVFDSDEAMLPSFGIFTGGFEIKALLNRKIFVIAEDKIMAV